MVSEQTKYSGKLMRIDLKLQNILITIQKSFEDKYNIKISLRKASKLVAEKINNAGGVTI